MRVLLLILILIFFTFLLFQLYLTNGNISVLSFDPLKIDKIQLEPLIKDPCVFLDTDINGKKVFDKYGTLISKNVEIECSRCGEHIYKEDDTCSTYEKDPFYFVKDRESGKNLSICSSLSFPRKCEFKNPPQTE